MRGSLWIVVGSLAAVSAYAPAAGQSLLEKSRSDQIASVPKDDSDMESAFRKARATLKEFLALVVAPRPSITNYAVKIGIPDRENVEYFWISRFVQIDGLLIGKIDNTPRSVKNVRKGERISFKESDVVDWLYRENGKMIGDYTACALIKKEPKEHAEAFKKQHGLNCDP